MQPSVSTDLLLGLTFKSYFVSFTFNHDDNAIAIKQPIVSENSNEQIITSINLDYRNTYSMVFSIPVQPTKWWSINLNLMGIRTEVKTVDGNETSQEHFRVSGSQNFLLPNRFAIDISGYYQSRSLVGVTKTKAFGNMIIGLQKKFSDIQKLRLTINHIFGFNFGRYTDESFNGLNYSTSTDYSLEPRIVKLIYSYNFGNKELKSKRNRSTGSEDIKNRMK